MCASQMIKTTIIQIALAYWMYIDPGPIGMLLPSELDIKRFVQDRLDSMLNDNPLLAEKVAARKSRDSGNTIERKEFEGGQLNLLSAQVEQSYASLSLRYGIADEWDRCPQAIGIEGSTASLWRNRFTNFFFNCKLIWSSSPTTEGVSNIGEQWKTSDQRFYHLPCPHCGQHQKLVWERIKWADLDPSTVWYDCLHCDQPIDEAIKFSEGTWIPENPSSAVPGYSISQLYSPIKPWRALVAEWLKAKGDRDEEKAFVNTKLGQLWRDAGEAPNWEILKSRAEDYRLGQLPKGALVLTAGIDVQGDRLEMAVWGWGRRGESWIIDYHVIEGRAGNDAAWEKLSNLLDVTYRHPFGADVFISRSAIDTGHRTSEVYGWLRRQMASRIFPIKGVTSAAGVFGRPSAVDLKSGGQIRRLGLKLWPVNVNMLKSELYGALLQTWPKGHPQPKNWTHLSQDLSDNWFRQLVAEEVVLAKTGRGYTEPKWVKKYDNEVLDTRIYARAAHHQLGCDHWPESRWAELERSMIVDQTSFEFSASVNPPTMPEAAAPRPSVSTQADQQSSPSRLAPPSKIVPAVAPAVRRWNSDYFTGV